MTLFNNLEFLFPYLISIRKMDKYISIDVRFDKNWKLLKKYINEEQILEIESSDINFRSFSFVIKFEYDEIISALDNIRKLIDYNKEREEKEKLFENKVNELKSFFEKQNLNDLQSLKFQIIDDKIELEDNEE